MVSEKSEATAVHAQKVAVRQAEAVAAVAFPAQEAQVLQKGAVAVVASLATAQPPMMATLSKTGME